MGFNHTDRARSQVAMGDVIPCPERVSGHSAFLYCQIEGQWSWLKSTCISSVRRGPKATPAMKNTLGGKGANLAEMAKLGLPVPAGFTITTEFCTVYLQEGNQFPDSLKAEVAEALTKVEAAMGMKFGDPDNPLLVSCRSGARKSMPGMMETVLNVGLCSSDDPGPDQEDRQRAVRLRRLPPPDHDVLRRGHGEGRGHRAGRGQGHPRAARAHDGRDEEGQGRASRHRPDGRRPEEAVRAVQGQGQGSARQAVPRRSRWSSCGAASARCSRAGTASGPSPTAASKAFRDEWGTAVNVQSMVFGNMGDNSATGVAFTATRPPARTSSTASGWSTPRAKTWWPASARPAR